MARNAIVLADNAAQRRRLLALAADREPRRPRSSASDADVRDWVLAFNADVPARLIDGKAPRNTALLDDNQRQALARIVESGSIPAATARAG